MVDIKSIYRAYSYSAINVCRFFTVTAFLRLQKLKNLKVLRHKEQMHTIKHK